MAVDTGSMSSRADEYLRYAKECAEAAERTADPQRMTEVTHKTADVFGVSRDLPITYVGDGMIVRLRRGRF